MNTLQITENWVWIDYVIALTITVLSLFGFTRGAVREGYSLLTWMTGVIIALAYNPDLSILIQGMTDNPVMRFVISFAILFFATLFFATLIQLLLREILNQGPTGFVSRLSGMIIGCMRGLLLGVMIVLAAGLTRLPSDPWWIQSILIPPFEKVAIWLIDMLPVNLINLFHFS